MEDAVTEELVTKACVSNDLLNIIQEYNRLHIASVLLIISCIIQFSQCACKYTSVYSLALFVTEEWEKNNFSCFWKMLVDEERDSKQYWGEQSSKVVRVGLSSFSYILSLCIFFSFLFYFPVHCHIIFWPKDSFVTMRANVRFSYLAISPWQKLILPRTSERWMLTFELSTNKPVKYITHWEWEAKSLQMTQNKKQKEETPTPPQKKIT